MMGKVSKDIATGVSITKVKIAIAAGGNPMPRNPLIIPAKKKAPKTINETLISGNGRSVFEINSFNIVSPYTPLSSVLFDARAL